MPFAAIEDVLAIGFATLCFFGVPVIAIMTSHQRKMAELMRRDALPPQTENDTTRRLQSLEAQMSDLRGMIQEHIINNDRPTTVSQSPPPVADIEQRFKS